MDTHITQVSPTYGALMLCDLVGSVMIRQCYGRTAKRFHTKAQGRPELVEGRTLGGVNRLDVTPQALHTGLRLGMCNSCGVIEIMAGAPRVRGCAATPGYDVERLRRSVAAERYRPVE